MTKEDLKPQRRRSRGSKIPSSQQQEGQKATQSRDTPSSTKSSQRDSSKGRNSKDKVKVEKKMSPNKDGMQGPKKDAPKNQRLLAENNPGEIPSSHIQQDTNLKTEPLLFEHISPQKPDSICLAKPAERPAERPISEVWGKPPTLDSESVDQQMHKSRLFAYEPRYYLSSIVISGIAGLVGAALYIWRGSKKENRKARTDKAQDAQRQRLHAREWREHILIEES